MAGEEEAEDPPVSALEDYPDYVNALGMISVELAELEASLAEVLRALLGVDSDVGQSIYFTPQAVIPRVKFLRNVNSALHPDATLDKAEVKEIRRTLNNICGRAEAVMGKRNRLLHANWGLEDEEVAYASFPLTEAGFKKIKLTELKRVVTDIRKVNRDTQDLVDLIVEYRKSASK